MIYGTDYTLHEELLSWYKAQCMHACRKANIFFFFSFFDFRFVICNRWLNGWKGYYSFWSCPVIVSLFEYSMGLKAKIKDCILFSLWNYCYFITAGQFSGYIMCLCVCVSQFCTNFFWYLCKCMSTWFLKRGHRETL